MWKILIIMILILSPSMASISVSNTIYTGSDNINTGFSFDGIGEVETNIYITPGNGIVSENGKISGGAFETWINSKCFSQLLITNDRINSWEYFISSDIIFTNIKSSEDIHDQTNTPTDNHDYKHG